MFRNFPPSLHYTCLEGYINFSSCLQIKIFFRSDNLTSPCKSIYRVIHKGRDCKYDDFKAKSNRLSSTISGNRDMDLLYTTSQVSNITRKTKFFSHHLTRFSRLNKK